MSRITFAYKDPEEITLWAERAAWEAQRLIDEAALPGCAVVDWGLDRRGAVAWLNIDSGEFNFDVAVSREFLDFSGFRDKKDTFLSYVRRARPGFFSQNGVGRHCFGLDLEAEEGVEVRYIGDREFRDFTKAADAEAKDRERRGAEWDEAEKARKSKK